MWRLSAFELVIIHFKCGDSVLLPNVLFANSQYHSHALLRMSFHVMGRSESIRVKPRNNSMELAEIRDSSEFLFSCAILKIGLNSRCVHAKLYLLTEVLLPRAPLVSSMCATILPMGVRTHFFQVVYPQDLECCPIFLGGGNVMDESRWLGTLILYSQQLWNFHFHLNVSRYCITSLSCASWESWRSHPELWQLSCVIFHNVAT